VSANLRQQVSAAAHASLPYANPLSPEQMAEVLACVADRQPATALDIGCGHGYFAVELASRVPVKVRAIDVNGLSLARARALASRTLLVGSIDFVERSFDEDEPSLYDLVVCMGSSGAMGSPRDAIQRCKQRMTPMGTLVLAELVWARTPPAEFLAFLGVDASFHWSQASGSDVLVDCGMVVQEQWVASEASWNHYEDTLHAGRLAFAEDLPPDDRAGVRAHAEQWMSKRKSHGAACLGFVAYVAQCRAG
jgi:cyclopropane fatty-acyl-phospholipid synthase-like methyltransferase